MKGFIVHAAHRVDDKTNVILSGRLENGQSFITTNTISPYFFIAKSDAAKNKHLLTKYTVEATKNKNFNDDDVVKVSHPSQTDINKIVEVLHKKSINTYEADIKPSMRFIIDHDLQGAIEIKGDHQPGERVDRIYTEPTITPTQFTPELKVASIDIESDKDSDKLFCIGLYTDTIKKVFMITDKPLSNVVSCKNEADCLEKFKQALIKADPDIITGWNIADFDFPYLKGKYEKNNVSFDISRDGSETRMRISNDFFKDSVINVAGRQVLDGLNLIQDPFIKEAPSIRNASFETWSLEDVAQSILKEGKMIVGKDRHEVITKLYTSQETKGVQKLADYNLQDCKLAFDILKKTKIIELAIERSQLTGLQFDRLGASIAAFDSLYIRTARKKNRVSPSTRFSAKEERIKGGYVMDSKPGIYHDLLVLDFKSLYPSIIKTFNIDPASFLEKKEKGSIESPNGAHFKNQQGILPEIINDLHNAREKAKKEERELASYAIKIIMNSFFGVLANPNCRYFSLDIANAITHFARQIIQLTAQKIEEKKAKVIYSDTDAVFVDTGLSGEAARKRGAELTQYINDFYKGWVQNNHHRTSYLELEFKKHYLAFMMPPLRSSEDKGSKKRYAGLVNVKGKEELEVVGLEAIRGDWTVAAQEFQEQLLTKIFKKEEFIPFIKSYVKKLKEGKMDDKLIYRKSLRKDLDEYTKTTPPHVKAARQLDSIESNVIEYYITVEGPEPIQKKRHDIDYDHYIHKQLEPIANTLLFFFHRKFEDILAASSQTKLFS